MKKSYHHAKESGQSGGKGTIPPLNSLAILKKEAGEDVFSLGADELCRRLHSGIVLHDKEKNIAAQKFWVDEKLDKNCFMLLPESLTIVWMDTSKYWEYINGKENCFDGEIDLPMAKLKLVCWLEVTGNFKTMLLSPKTTYEVAFLVKFSEGSYGWHLPVTLNLHLPDGSTQSCKVNLGRGRREEWFRIPIGNFTTSPKNVGDLSFSLKELGGHRKSGLIIKGVLIQAQD